MLSHRLTQQEAFFIPGYIRPKYSGRPIKRLWEFGSALLPKRFGRCRAFVLHSSPRLPRNASSATNRTSNHSICSGTISGLGLPRSLICSIPGSPELRVLFLAGFSRLVRQRLASTLFILSLWRHLSFHFRSYRPERLRFFPFRPHETLPRSLPGSLVHLQALIRSTDYLILDVRPLSCLGEVDTPPPICSTSPRARPGIHCFRA